MQHRGHDEHAGICRSPFIRSGLKVATHVALPRYLGLRGNFYQWEPNWIMLACLEAVLPGAKCSRAVELWFASIILLLYDIARQSFLTDVAVADHPAGVTMSLEKSPPLEDADTRIHLPSLLGFKASADDRLPLHTEPHVRTHTSSSWKRGLLLVSTLSFLLVLFRCHLLPCLPFADSRAIVRNPAYLITADHGAVAAENKRCSDIGVDILKDGGNAVDAAIGASLCTGVVNMFS